MSALARMSMLRDLKLDRCDLGNDQARHLALVSGPGPPRRPIPFFALFSLALNPSRAAATLLSRAAATLNRY
jgi:hypothetical protein